MRTGLTKQEKTTDIWFDEKAPLIHIRTHNTDLKRRLAAYAEQYPDECCKTDTDPETGCMEFEIAKGRFSFRLTAPFPWEPFYGRADPLHPAGGHPAPGWRSPAGGDPAREGVPRPLRHPPAGGRLRHAPGRIFHHRAGRRNRPPRRYRHRIDVRKAP